MVHRNALRLLKLVNSLLDFTRIEARRMQAAYVPTDITSMVVDLCGVFRSAMERAGLRFTVDASPIGEPVYIDIDMFEKIVFNLLSNALKVQYVVYRVPHVHPVLSPNLHISAP